MDVTSIAAMSTDMSRQTLSSEVSVRVARKAMDAHKQQGDAAVQMLDAAMKLTKELAQSPRANDGRLDITA